MEVHDEFMAAGVNSDLNGNPWIFTFDGSTATHTLPYIVIPIPANGFPYTMMPYRTEWIDVAGAAGNEIIITDNPPNAFTARVVYHAVATGADFMVPYETHDNRKVPWGNGGMIITTFGAGELRIYL